MAKDKNKNIYIVVAIHTCSYMEVDRGASYIENVTVTYMQIEKFEKS